MHSLAALEPRGESSSRRLQAIATAARQYLPEDSVPAAMFDFVKRQHAAGASWEETRDAIYQRYQIEQQDGYEVTSRRLYCNGCFASGINFAASLVSLFYGEGDFKETLKIAVLAGWDSDNPAATWGGLLGYMLGRQAIEHQFDQSLSDQFAIHRTRKGFPNDGVDSFCDMARMGIEVSQRVKVEYQE
jgi:ADP-ribosylglycohydrolase